MKRKGTIKYLTAIVGLILIINFFVPCTAFANANIAPISPINISIGNGAANQGTATTLQLLFAITIISLAPSILLMMTCFTRIIIVLHFLRSGIGTQQMPPNQILIGLALFLTFFLMAPNLQKINENALKPLSEGTITQEVAIKNAMEPFREFMLRQVEDKDLGLFTELSGNTSYASINDIPNSVLIPSFVLGELKKGFIIGFLIYIPFIVIDMVISSTLMAMGMMMLPPSMISLPFKVLFFIMVDGWGLVVENLIKTFR